MFLFKKKIKKKKKEEKPVEKEQKQKKVYENKKKTRPRQQEKPVKREVKRGGRVDTSVLIKPMITEKATELQGQNCYVFEVSPKANKIMVKGAIRSFYGVDPFKVNIIKLKGKKVRYGRSTGRTKSQKKAVVFLKKGDKIEFTNK